MDGLIAGPAIVVLLIACCSASSLSNLFNSNPAQIDCGMASNGINTCFDQAIQACTPAKVRVTQVPVEIRITGGQGDNCDVEMAGISVSSWENELQTASPSDYANVQQEFSSNQQAQSIMAGLEGKTAECVIPKGEIATIGSDQMLQVCHGNLMTYIQNIMNSGQ